MDMALNNNQNFDWNSFLLFHQKREELDSNVFDTFYSKTELIDLNDQVATVKVESAIQKNLLTQNVNHLQDSLKAYFGKFLPIRFVLNNEVPTKAAPIIEARTVEVENEYKDNIKPEFTFDNFVVGPNNRESHAAALATASMPTQCFYNPLFIYGNSGLGKTHLLNAIGNHIKKNTPEVRVKYTGCNDFVNAYIKGLRENKIDEFNQFYRDVDVLLVDDIQFLAGKQKSHEMFFHLFNDLVDNKKQIVITSDRHPSELQGLEDRLVSRFESGLSVGIDTPEFETARAILESKISNLEDTSNLDDDVINYIASRYNSDVRKLEGALNRLMFYSITFGDGSNRITIDTALNAFKGLDSLKPGEELTLEKIKQVVADYYGLTKQQLVSKSRTSNIATARHIAIYLCRKHLDMPFAKIGEGFGKRDHSTVMSSYDKVNKLLTKDDAYQLAIKEIEKILINK